MIDCLYQGVYIDHELNSGAEKFTNLSSENKV